jgi:hypothetical protein
MGSAGECLLSRMTGGAIQQCYTGHISRSVINRKGYKLYDVSDFFGKKYASIPPTQAHDTPSLKRQSFKKTPYDLCSQIEAH